jgi:hypothetical protein
MHMEKWILNYDFFFCSAINIYLLADMCATLFWVRWMAYSSVCMHTIKFKFSWYSLAADFLLPVVATILLKNINQSDCHHYYELILMILIICNVVFISMC